MLPSTTPAPHRQSPSVVAAAAAAATAAAAPHPIQLSLSLNVSLRRAPPLPPSYSPPTEPATLGAATVGVEPRWAGDDDWGSDDDDDVDDERERARWAAHLASAPSPSVPLPTIDWSRWSSALAAAATTADSASSALGLIAPVDPLNDIAPVLPRAVVSPDTHTFECTHDDCGRSYPSQDSLKTHYERYHKPGRRLFVCTYGCGEQRRYTQNGALNYHLRACHWEEFVRRHPSAALEQRRSHQCRLCERDFLDSGSLRRHVLTHTSWLPYACNECPGTFRQSGQLTKHKQQCHLVGGCAFACTHCTGVVRFSSKAALDRHWGRQHRAVCRTPIAVTDRTTH
jgi:hypothetical protein